MKNNALQEICKKAWKIGPPNDRYKYAIFVEEYTWRGDRCILKIIELDGNTEIHHRVWGWITRGGQTRYLGNGEIDLELANEILNQITAYRQPCTSDSPQSSPTE